ncbi:hypothetical protein [Halobacteriovorax sp. BALOs_7]|uniref:hypothetical protein n=1 Tax=Halobacteriovorax sp. BALOs_7 TaxID=2109558 RepID=UPI0013C43EA2|nr:hypothetical protein [Halobacteriovorax sp. BALOs_7]
MLETYIYGEKAHVPAFISKAGKIYRVISDNLGSVLKVVDIATGAVAQSLTYNTFGEIISDSNPGFQPFAYAGGLYDIHTGLTRFGARDYNPIACYQIVPRFSQYVWGHLQERTQLLL